MSTNSPWYSASSSVHISFIASIRSRVTFQRSAKRTPSGSISSASQPAPMPNRKRPPEIMSRLAICLARAIGSCSVTRQMPVPSLSSLVAPAAAASATNGSWMRRYSSGSEPSGVPGNRVSRSTGMWTCSGTQSDSKPRSSAARASEIGSMARSVAKMNTPCFIGDSFGLCVVAASSG